MKEIPLLLCNQISAVPLVKKQILDIGMSKVDAS